MTAHPRPEDPKRRRAAFQRANWLLTGAGLTLTLAGVSPRSPEVQAIGHALRALNLASGLEKGRKEGLRAYPPGGPRFGKSAG